jgi:hypothetical protein
LVLVSDVYDAESRRRSLDIAAAAARELNAAVAQ